MSDEERMEVLFYDFWFPPQITMAEYELQLSRVAEEMADGAGIY